MSTKALLIDLDGVIRHWRQSDAHIEIAYGLPEGAIRDAAFSPELLLPAITGLVSDQAWRALIARRLATVYEITDADRLVETWSLQAGEIDQEVIALLRRCSPDIRIVLVTNATSRLPQDLANLEIGELFFSIVNSSEIKIAKPARGIFEAALLRLNVSPDEAIFVDDSTLNVDAASSLGIRSHRYINVSSMADFLERSGALLEAQL